MVSSLNASSYLDGDADCLLEAQLSFFLNVSLQCDAFHILHDNIVHAILTSDIVDIDNIRVL